MNGKNTFSVQALFKDRNMTSYINLGCAAFSVVILITFCIYGAVNRYDDWMVCLDIILAAVCFTGYFIFNSKPTLRWLNLLGVFFLSFALTFFFLNSYPVWADELNNITMYNSRGGLAPVITIIVMMLACIIAAIVSCFMPSEEKKA